MDKCNTKLYTVLNCVNTQIDQRGVNTRNVNMIVSCVRVPKGVPRFKEESFMIIGCSVNDFNIVKIKSVIMFVYMLSNL